jgi:uncharacterized damage-inducible protein DinB
MDVATIRSIFGYDRWATDHVLTCCEPLTVEQFTVDRELPWGSIRDQLVHQFIVHKRWLSWADGSLSGEEAYALLANPEDYPDVPAVREMWNDVNLQNTRFLDRMTPDDLVRELRVDAPGAEFALAVGQVMLHIAYHSMQHRTEVTTALTSLGHSPGDIDYLFYALGGNPG